jgi:hypothetical protein
VRSFFAHVFRHQQASPLGVALKAIHVHVCFLAPIESLMRTATNTTTKLCSLCGKPIAPARLEALPGVTTCIECAKKHPRQFDPRSIDLSQASPINRNGFAPTD